MADNKITKDNAETFNKKIRSKMIKTIVLLVSLILTGLFISTLIITRNQFIEELKQQCLYKVDYSSVKIEKWLGLKRAYLEGIAHVVINSFKNNLEMEEETLKKYMTEYKVNTVFMGFPDGKMIDSGIEQNLPTDFDPRTRPWYKQAVKAKKLLLTSLYKDAATGDLVTTMSMPVYHNTTLIGVLGMDIPLDEVIEIIRSLKVGQNSSAHLVNEEGTYIYSDKEDKILSETIHKSEDAEIFKAFLSNEQNSVIYERKDYIVARKIPLSLWYVFFHLPSSEVNQPLVKVYITFGAGLITAIFTLILVIRWISSLISSPILKLADGVKEISAGRYGKILEIPSKDEVGYLTYAFNQMSKDLEEKEFIRSTFGRYVSEDVVRELLGNPKGLELGGKKEHVTILMSDLRGFTRMSEKLGAEAVVSLLNNYLGEMTDIIMRYGGTIDEFIGDAIMVIFGAPIRFPDHAACAAACAIEMQLAMEKVNQWNRQNNYPEIEMGIGINTGNAVVGNIGSNKRSKFGVVGKHVNLTARIEAYTTGGQIYISENTKEILGSALKIADQFQVKTKGVETPITVYSISAISGDYNLALKQETPLYINVEDKKALIHYNILEGKNIADKTYTADVIKLSSKEAVIRLPDNERQLDLHYNVQLKFVSKNAKPISEDVYGKVTDVKDMPFVNIRFTSNIESIDELIERLNS
ncbi:Adenylyl cyclase class-3/4/guanylyl cyclase [Candidatus Magnetoovum chiemensis]|nr:Adenylyl cyclase class-3/4/guanylyl cyclase [Candidatus Magnetoovum chiemensis]